MALFRIFQSSTGNCSNGTGRASSCFWSTHCGLGFIIPLSGLRSCCMSMSITHASCLCPCCLPMPALHFHVRASCKVCVALSLSLMLVYVSVANPHPCCTSMPMLHVLNMLYFHGVGPSCISMVHVHVFMLLVHSTCSCWLPRCMSMLHFYCSGLWKA